MIRLRRLVARRIAIDCQRSETTRVQLIRANRASVFITVGIGSHVASDVNRHIPMITAESSAPFGKCNGYMRIFRGNNGKCGRPLQRRGYKTPHGCGRLPLRAPICFLLLALSPALLLIFSASYRTSPVLSDPALRPQSLASWLTATGVYRCALSLSSNPSKPSGYW